MWRAVTDRMVRRAVPLGHEKAKDDSVHVVFGIDKNYARPMGVLMTSILECTDRVAFHIFADEIDPADIERIRRTATRYGAMCHWYEVDAAAFASFPTTRTWTMAMYFRFIAAEYLARMLDRVIYLDADMICMGSLRPLYEMDMIKKGVGAATDPGLPAGRLERIGHTGDGYFNSGVMLIDLSHWRETRIFEKAVSLLGCDHSRFEAYDQDVLNLIYSDDVLWLEKKYNQENNVADSYPEDTVIIHYTSTPKPWLAWYYTSGENIWAKAAARSEWRDVPLICEPRTTREARLMGRASFCRGEWAKGIAWYIRYLTKKLGDKVGV